MKETKLFKITVNGKTQGEIDQFFKQLTEFCDVEVEEIRPKIVDGFLRLL